MSRSTIFVTFSTIVALAILVSESSSSGHQQSAKFPSARTSKDGDIWLSWHRSQRIGFLDGFRKGFKEGHQSGCNAAIDIFIPGAGPIDSPASPYARCFDAQMRLSGPLDQYEKEITAFYQRYPSDREIPLPAMLWLLSDSVRATIEEIHQCYLSGPMGECKLGERKKVAPLVK
jgi:hypothetical protein